MSIEVRPVRRRGRVYWQAEWRDPVTGLIRSQSTKCTKKKDADRACAKIAHDLETGVYRFGREISWKDFRERHEQEVQAGLAKKTRDKYAAIFGHVEEVIRPARLAALDGVQLSRLQRVLLDGRPLLDKERRPVVGDDGKPKMLPPLAPITVRTSMVYLRAALKWAVDCGMLATLPRVKLPKRVAAPKSRAITGEEFERMRNAVAAVVGVSPRFNAEKYAGRREARIAAWTHLLDGLWLSGLRLDEALDLHWTSDRMLHVDFRHRRPMFVMRPEADKTFRDRLFPMAPEFAEFLLRTPERNRRGYVFDPMPERTGAPRMRLDSVSKVIERIGRKSLVRVSPDGRKPKYASAQCLRKSFGFRWAMRVMPAVLKELMRHDEIGTTMQFYIGHEAEAVADVIWGLTDTSTDTRASEPFPTGVPLS